MASPEAEAWILLEHLTGLDRLTLITAPDVPRDATSDARTDVLVARRAAGEPLQHLIGVASFYGVELEAGPAALVPRPETERLVQLVLQDLVGRPAPVLLDVGTGGGAIAIAIACERPDAEVWASDVDPRALELAARNARRHAPRVRTVQADLLDGPDLATVVPRLHLLVSNPPYLPEADRESLPPEVRHDPPAALFGGPDGLEPFRRLLRAATERLPARAPLWLELDPRTVHAAAEAAAAAGWAARVHEDLARRPRFLEARRAETGPR